MKKTIKIIILSVFAIFILKKNSMAYTVSSWTHMYNWSIYGSEYNNFYFDKNLELSNIDIKMTQDDNYYNFDVSVVASLNSSIRNKIAYTSFTTNSLKETTSLCKSRLEPFLYGVANFTNWQIHRQCYFQFDNGGDYYTFDHYLYVMNSKISSLYYRREYVSGGSSNTFYSELKSNYFYIPHPIKEAKLGFNASSNWTNPNTGNRDVSHPNGTDSLKRHDGFTLISNSCSLKNYTLNGSLINTAEYNINSKFKIQKNLFSKYRYLAYGGLNFLTMFKYYNDFVSDYQGICSTSNTIDLGEYAECKHKWIYDYDEDSSTHEKYCEKCNWRIVENHKYKYEYDGICDNLCECGKKLNVKCHFLINDDYTDEKHIVSASNSNHEIYGYDKKEGYEFLYYEKYEKHIASFSDITLSTKSNILKDVFIATVSEIDNHIGNYSKVYKAIYTPIMLNVIFETDVGVFRNNDKKISIYIDYNYFNDFEKIYGIKEENIYFEGWYYNGKLIRNVNEIKKLTTTQNQTFIIKAKHGKPEYGQSENPKDGLYPSANGGLIDRKYKPITPKEQTELELFEEDVLREDIKRYIDNNPKVKKELNINDIEIYDMTKTELTNLYLLLGLDIASISNAKKMKQVFNLFMIEPYKLFFIVMGVIFIFIIVFELLFIYKKDKKNKKNKQKK